METRRQPDTARLGHPPPPSSPTRTYRTRHCLKNMFVWSPPPLSIGSEETSLGWGRVQQMLPDPSLVRWCARSLTAFPQEACVELGGWTGPVARVGSLVALASCRARHVGRVVVATGGPFTQRNGENYGGKRIGATDEEPGALSLPVFVAW